MMNRSHPGLVGLAALAAALGGAASAARAQNALGDGRALDNKAVPGQGTPTGQPTASKRLEDQIRFNNQIATGQAGAGRSFRGSMGYRGTDEFRGTLGTESLFQFRRETNVANALAGAGVRASDALRFQAGLSTGQGAAPAAAALFSDRRGSVASGDTLSSLRSPAQYQSRSALMPTVLGYRTVESLGPLVITASPLRGLGWVPLDAGSGPVAGSAPGPVPIYEGAAALSGLERVARGVAPVSDSRQMRQAREMAKLAGPSAAGGPIDVRLSPPVDDYGRVMQRVSQAIEQRIIDPGAAVSTRPVAQPAGATGAAGQREIKDAGAGPGDPVVARPAWLDELDDLRRKLRGERAEQAGEAGARPKVEQRLNPRTGRMEDVEPEQPEGPGLNSSELRVVDALKVAEETVVNFVPAGVSGADVFASRMAEGQRCLAERRYFDAEAAFTVAAAAQRDHPMALMGRVHAQLGAGLFLSAAANLRAALTLHPELVATKYAPGLLPPRERAAALHEQISADLGRELGVLGADGALLIAYMGRQYGTAGWLERGLGELRARTDGGDGPGLALVALLERVWGAAPAAPAPAKAP